MTLSFTWMANQNLIKQQQSQQKPLSQTPNTPKTNPFNKPPPPITPFVKPTPPTTQKPKDTQDLSKELLKQQQKLQQKDKDLRDKEEQIRLLKQEVIDTTNNAHMERLSIKQWIERRRGKIRGRF